MVKNYIPDPTMPLADADGRINTMWYDFLLFLFESGGGGEELSEEMGGQAPLSPPGPQQTVTPTAPQLAMGAMARLDDVEARLQLLEDLIHGTTQIHRGLIADIPDGWQLADGTNGTDDLRGLMPLGGDADSGGTFDVGDTGGGAIEATVGAPDSTLEVASGTGSTVASDTHEHVVTVDPDLPPYFVTAFIQKV